MAKTGNLARWLSVGLGLADLKRWSRIPNPIGLAEKAVTNESLFVNAQYVPFSRSKASVDMNANTNWNRMIEDHEIAVLRAGICLGSPQSYSLEEKKRICADMEASAAAIDAALKADFESLPPKLRACSLTCFVHPDA